MGKVYNGIMGLVVGDALGVPYEFKQRDTFKATDMIGYGTYNQPAGTWSDDSSMTLATLESFSRLGRIETEDIMNNFFDWLYRGKFTPHGQVFDVGNTTRQAINRFGLGAMPENCGGRNATDNGNGSLMRILPLAFMDISMRDVIRVSQLTHAHEVSIAACLIYILIARKLIVGIEKEKAVILGVKAVEESMPEEYSELEYLKYLKRDEIRSSGYVVDTLEAALWCFLKTDNYRDCVLEAVNLGGDTDTIAAVAGGLAGICYGVGGEKGIPEEWIEKIACKEWIKELCEKVENNG